MKSMLFLIFYLISLLAVAAPESGSGNEIGKDSSMPNIILIMADDMGYECLSCNGSLSYKTPRLDKLAQNGMRFINCYAQPLCTPSRVKIMTGKYNCHNYVDFGYLDVKEKTFGNIFKQAGYKTMVAGKWQLNGVQTREEGYEDQDRPHHFGFDEYCLWWLTGKGSRYANPQIVRNGEKLETTINDYGPDIVSDYVVSFLEKNQKKKFFIYYPMLLVHPPFQPTPDSEEWASPETRRSTDDRFFKDMVEYSDKVVGKILDKLEELNISENTIVIFTGDNGTYQSIVTQTVTGPYKGGKGTLRDNGTNVPLIISWPATGRKGLTKTELVEFSDFVPTFAQAVGVPLEDNVDGKSFYDLIIGKPYKPRETIFVHYYPNPQQVSSRSGCFTRNNKYKLYYDGRFFDMDKDKWEENPLNPAELKGQEKNSYEMLKKELESKPVWDFSVPHREFRGGRGDEE